MQQNQDRQTDRQTSPIHNLLIEWQNNDGACLSSAGLTFTVWFFFFDRYQ